MAPTRYLSALLLALGSLKAIRAVPLATTVFPEVIPGPGLPSLESLNLTSYDLYTKKPDLTAIPLALRAALFVGECGPSDDAYTDVNDIIACYNYLLALGTTGCGASDYSTVAMCTAGAGKITATSIVAGTASSYCRDAANGALWVINDCTRPDQSVAGYQAAYGNGDLIVGCVNINY